MTGYTLHTYPFRVAPHGVIDGDTLTGALRTRTWYGKACDVDEKVRFAWIDCPELHSHDDRLPDPYALEAKAMTQRYCEAPKGRWIRVRVAKNQQGQYLRESRGKWQPARLVAEVRIRRWWGWQSLNLLLVRKGLAQPFGAPEWITPHIRRALHRAQARAQQTHRGIYQRRSSWWWGWVLGLGAIILGGLLVL